MTEGKLVPDSIILNMMEKRLEEQDCREGYILDGFPRTIPQAEGLDNLLDEIKTILFLYPELLLNFPLVFYIRN